MGRSTVPLPTPNALGLQESPQSVGTVGDSYDNARTETANDPYTAELNYSQPVWDSLTDVEFATMNWIHWPNTTRLHEVLGYQTLTETKAQYTEPLTHSESSSTTT